MRTIPPYLCLKTGSPAPIRLLLPDPFMQIPNTPQHARRRRSTAAQLARNIVGPERRVRATASVCPQRPHQPGPFQITNMQSP